MRNRKTTAIVPFLLAAFMIAPANAGSVTTFDDIDTWVGFGSQEAALVLDWNDGHEPVLLGYRFDGSKTGEDMLLEIAIAHAELFVRVGEPHPTYGKPIYGIGYDRNGGGFGIRDDQGDESFIFDSFGIAVTGAPDAVDSAAVANDPNDSYFESWNGASYWSFWNDSGLPKNGGWLSPDFGASGRTVVDGGWDGFAVAPSYLNASPPGIVITVPEPTCAFALVTVGVCFASQRRRRA